MEIGMSDLVGKIVERLEAELSSRKTNAQTIGPRSIRFAVDVASWVLRFRNYVLLPIKASMTLDVYSDAAWRISVASVVASSLGCEYFAKAYCVAGGYDENCPVDVPQQVLSDCGGKLVAEFLDRPAGRHVVEWIRWAVNDASVALSDEIVRMFRTSWTSVEYVNVLVGAMGSDGGSMRRLIGVMGIANATKLVRYVARYGRETVAKAAAIAAARLIMDRELRVANSNYEPYELLNMTRWFGEDFAKALDEELVGLLLLRQA